MQVARFSILVAALGGAVGLASGVFAQPPTSHAAQRVEAGPVVVDLSLDRETMNAADSLVVTLAVSAPSGVSVELPSPQDRLGEFRVAGVSDEPAVAASGAATPLTKVVRHFTLEPFLPGDYSVPALEVQWKRFGTSDAGVALTAPVSVKVVSLLPEAAQKPDADLTTLDPGAIRGQYTPPRRRNWTSLVLAAGGGACVTLLAGWGAVVVRRRRGRRDRVAVLIQEVEAARTLEKGVLCDALACAVREGLADRVDPGAASLLATELDRLPRGPFFSEQMAIDCARLLSSLDEARYSGRSIEPTERSRLCDEALSVLRTLLRMPRSVEVRA